MKEPISKKSARKGPVCRMSTAQRRTVVGIDISERYLQVREIDANDVVTGGRFVTSERRLRDQFEGRDPCRVIIEMGSNTRWIAEILKGLGLRCSSSTRAG